MKVEPSVATDLHKSIRSEEALLNGSVAFTVQEVLRCVCLGHDFDLWQYLGDVNSEIG